MFPTRLVASRIALVIITSLFSIGVLTNPLRPGVFFFILALFGFSSLTTLGLFANERVLFMRER